MLSTVALRLLGFGAYHARRAAQKFKTYDEDTILELAQSYGMDPNDFLGEIRRRIRTIDQLFEAERSGSTSDSGWDPPRP